MNRTRLERLVGPDLAPLVERRLQEDGARDVGAILVALCDEGHLDRGRLRELLASLERAITLSGARTQVFGGRGSTGGARASQGEGTPLEPGPNYRVAGLLGRGAMGEVHVARDPSLARNVAVKKMDPRIADHPVLSGRFHAEAQITAQLDHPGIVPVYALSADDRGVPQYSMKLIRGRTLTEYLAACKAAYADGGAPDDEHDLPARLEVFLQICNAVAYAHARGVLHRDLKPDNVMLGAFREVLVMDWGVAKVIEDGEDDVKVEADVARPEGTDVGVVIGTAPYCSPEQARGENDGLDARSDQYALGLILYELICLRRAVSGPSPYLVLLRAAEGKKAAWEHAFGEEIPAGLQAIVDKATALRREDRYAGVEEMAADVRRYLRDEEVLVAPDRGLQKAQRWVAHNRQATLALGAALSTSLITVVLLAIVGGLVAYEVSRRAAERREQRLADAMAVAERRASAIDAELMRQEAIVTGIAAAAAEALTRPPPGVPVYTAEAFPAGEVPDLVDSPFYEGPISLGHADLYVPPGADLDALDARTRQLASIRPALYRALVDTDGFDVPEGLATDARLVADGLAGVWTYVGTAEGLLVGFPGIGQYPEGYDPRQRPWYASAAAGRGPQWSALAVDESDLGLLLTCTLTVEDPAGAALGVAALDLDFARFISTFLDARVEDPSAEAWLVDAEGRVVVRSTQRDVARDLTSYEPEPFPHGEVLAAARARPVGHAAIPVGEARRLFAWAPLDAVDWLYVVELDEAAWMATR